MTQNNNATGPQQISADTFSILAAVYGHSPAGTGVFSHDGALVYANGAWSGLLGSGALPADFFRLAPGCGALFASVADGSRQRWSGSLPVQLASGRQLFRARLFALSGHALLHGLVVAELSGMQQENAPAAGCDVCPSWQLPVQLYAAPHALHDRLEAVFSVLMHRLDCSCATLWLAPQGDEPAVLLHAPDGAGARYSSRLFGASFARHVLAQGDIVVLDKAGAMRLAESGILPADVPLPDAAIAAPLCSPDGRTMGVLTACRRNSAVRFGMNDARFLRNAANIMATVERIHQSETALRESETRFRAVFDHAGLGIVLLTPQGTVKSVNKGAADLASIPAAEMLGLHYSDFLCADDVTVADRFFHALQGGADEVLTMTSAIRRRHAPPIWCKLTVSRVLDEGGSLRFIIVQIEDVTDHKREDERLTHMAYHDVLTGLPNRALFLDRLQSAFNRAQRNASYSFAVLYMDMDGFKDVNDSMGHDAGDALLGMFAERVGNCLRNVDTLARLGGDEFAVLLDDVPEILQVTHVIERITEAVSSPFMLRGREIRCGVSIGAVLRGQECSGCGDLLRQADSAMYKAKRRGSNRYVIAGSSDAAAARVMRKGEQELVTALDSGQLELFFQPVVSLQTGRMDAVEALVRWHHPERGLLAPGAFLPLAEHAGLQAALDAHVLRLAARAQLAMQEQEARGAAVLSVHVNMLSETLRRPEMPGVLLGVLQEEGAAADRFIFELVENLLVNAAPAVAEGLWRLRDAGIRLALDGFGSGYSSLAMLRRYPLSLLKVDGSFVRASDADMAARGIVRSARTLAGGFSMKAVAEGVELPEHAELLRELGYSSAQGMYFAAPMRLSRLLRMHAAGAVFPVMAG
jgi:diguanylate cyclase (GGDEF)-like protein/PAS domain S-box-containing protein